VATGFDQPSALQALEDGNFLDVVATEAGSDVPTIVSMGEIPIAAVSSEVSTLSGSDFVVVATLVTVSPGQALTSAATSTESALGIFIPPAAATVAGAEAGILEAAQVAPAAFETALAEPAPYGESWDGYLQGVPDALQRRQERQQVGDRLEQIFDGMDELWRQMLITQPWPAGCITMIPAAPVQSLTEPVQTVAPAAIQQELVQSIVAVPAENDTNREAPPAVDAAQPSDVESEKTVNDSARTLGWHVKLAVCLVGSLIGAAQQAGAPAQPPKSNQPRAKESAPRTRRHAP
jgi:hypothetical protein